MKQSQKYNGTFLKTRNGPLTTSEMLVNQTLFKMAAKKNVSKRSIKWNDCLENILGTIYSLCDKLNPDICSVCRVLIK